jgi:hypothetical protein
MFGCLIEAQDDTCVAYRKGTVFSSADMARLAKNLKTFVFCYDEPEEDGIEIRAVDLPAALQLFKYHYGGEWTVFVRPPLVELGAFDMAEVV